MQQKIHPGVASAIIAVVMIVVAILAWHIFAPSHAPQPSGNVQTNPTAQAQFGSPRLSSRPGSGAPAPR